MIEPAIPRDEEKRLAALRALGLLDSPADKAFDEIVELTRLLLDVPMALVSLVDSDRQWFKAAAGVGVCETSRSVSFCAHAIHEDDVFVVPDASFDPRFHDNPLVAGEPHIRFYAGFPLRLPSGHRIGTLCALSPVAREEFDAAGRRKMQLLGGLVLDAIELRTARAEIARGRVAIDRHSALWHALGSPIAFADRSGRIETCNAAFSLLCAAGDPIGKPFNAALGLPEEVWSPAAMVAAGSRVGRIEAPGTPGAFEVHLGPGGFTFVGSPAEAGA